MANPSFYGGQADTMLGEARSAGLFDPTQKRLREMLRRQALRYYQNSQRRAGAASQLYGLDPNQQRAGLFNNEIQGTGALSDSLLNSDLQGYQSGQNYYRSLFDNLLGHDYAHLDAKAQARAAREGGIGSALGGLGVAAVTGGANYLARPKGP